MVPLSRVDASEERVAPTIPLASRLVRGHLVEDFLAGALCLLLWAALWSLFIVAYRSPSVDLDEGGENTALERTDWERSVPEAVRYVASEIPKP